MNIEDQEIQRHLKPAKLSPMQERTKPSIQHTTIKKKKERSPSQETRGRRRSHHRHRRQKKNKQMTTNAKVLTTGDV